MSTSYAELISQLNGPPLVVIGDFMLDEYLYGRVRRISWEAPAPIVELEEERWVLGGAGNVIHNLVQFGCTVFPLGVIGEDKEGERLTALVASLGVSNAGLLVDPGRPTSRKARILARQQQILRVDREQRGALSEVLQGELLNQLERVLADSQGVIVSDYGKGVLTERVLQGVLERARQLGKPVYVDPKGVDFRRYRGAEVVTPNQHEAEQATGIPLNSPDQWQQAAETLIQQTQGRATLITLGARGMFLQQRDGFHCHIPARAREVYDVTGAGDTVVALVAACAAAGLSLQDAATIANAAAGIVVGKLGTATVSRAELVDHLQQPYQRKVKSTEELAAILQEQRRQGKKVVFTNGCYDLLHYGHIQALQAAKRMGDMLVVAINSDSSVRQLKGQGRPIISEKERAYMLAALDCVDYVTVFTDLTPIPLLQRLRPDILAKGGDYRLDQVVGRELVESYGGRVALLPVVEGLSTTNIISTVLANYGSQ